MGYIGGGVGDIKQVQKRTSRSRSHSNEDLYPISSYFVEFVQNTGENFLFPKYMDSLGVKQLVKLMGIVQLTFGLQKNLLLLPTLIS